IGEQRMDVKTIAVIGAGTMGRGIAYAAALGGYNTVLEDVSRQVLEQGVAWIRQSFEEGVARDKVAKTDAIFASNTSSLSITDFTDVTVSRERCIGMHFFNPVPKMKLIELVRTPHASGETVATCREVARRMGKEVVIVNEAPGFITTRVNALIGNEAFNMLEAGIATPEDIDKALKLGLNHPMGPFELVDLVGLDVRLKILEYLHQTLGEKYRPNSLLRQYVQEGRLGRKSGRGVYDYSQQKAAEKKA